MSKYQALIDALKAGPTDGKWQVWTSNSFRRIKTDAGVGVVEPITQRHDGHPDLYATPETLDYIAAANPATIRSILADLERAEKDAERYRALRDGQSPLSVGRHVSVCDEYPRYEEVNWLHESELDAAIDAALSQLKGVQ